MRPQEVATMHRLRHGALALAILLLATAAQAATTDVISRSFSVAPGGKLTVDSSFGSIQVETVPGATAVKIDVERTARTNDRADAQRLFDRLDYQFSQNGNEVRLEIRDREKLSLWRSGNSIRVTIRATIPQNFGADLATAGGSIRLGDLRGNARLRTSGGSLTIGRIDGTVAASTSGGSIELAEGTSRSELRTSGGSIRVGQAAGHLSARTSGGSIHVSRADGQIELRTSGGQIVLGDAAGVIDARTSGGSVKAGIRQLRGPSRLATSGGSIAVSLPPSIGAVLDARTSAGRVQSSIPVTVEGEMVRSRLRGRINAGGPLLELRTSAGSISIDTL
jgi:hypothetical protein